jgi:hypothetical protein
LNHAIQAAGGRLTSAFPVTPYPPFDGIKDRRSEQQQQNTPYNKPDYFSHSNNDF